MEETATKGPGPEDDPQNRARIWGIASPYAGKSPTKRKKKRRKKKDLRHVIDPAAFATDND